MGTKLKTPGQAHSLLYSQQSARFGCPLLPQVLLAATCWVNPTIPSFLAN